MSQRIADASAKVARPFYSLPRMTDNRPFGLFRTIDRALWRGRSALERCEIVQFTLGPSTNAAGKFEPSGRLLPPVRMFTSHSAGNCRLNFYDSAKSPYFTGLDGGRTRDRTLDLSRVKGTLSR
jgi:hypothetical protein